MKRWLVVSLLLIAPTALAQEETRWVWPHETPPEVGVTAEPPPPCPCFSQADIDAAQAACSSTVENSCADTADPYYLVYACNPGGQVPPSVLGVYLVRDQQDQCSREDLYGRVPTNGRYRAITQPEVDACIALVDTNCPSILDDAVNYWAMEESGTNDRLDSIGTNDLTPTVSINTIAGKNNLTVDLDDATKYLTDAAWRCTGCNAFSISMWVKRASTAASSTRWAISENTGSNPAFFVYHSSTSLIFFGLRNSGSIVTTNHSGINITTWRHLVLTWTAGAGMKTYIDGADEKTSAVLTGPMRDNSAGIFVGGGLAGNEWGFTEDGYIDEVAMFETDIGAAGAAEIWAGGAGKFY